MNTIELKSTLHQLIDQINDNAVLQAYTTLLSREATHKADFWDDLTPAQQAKIDKGLADLSAGKKKSLADVLAKYQW